MTEEVRKHIKFNMELKIIGYEMTEELIFPFKKYILYIININTNAKTWEIKRRYTDFENLHKKLSKFIKNLPKLPPKSIFLTDNKIKERQMLLKKYLNCLILNPKVDIYKHNEIFEFLEMEKEHYLLLKESYEDNVSTDYSHSEGYKIKSLLNLKKPKTSGILINDNFFYSKPFYVSNQPKSSLNVLKDVNKNHINSNDVTVLSFLTDLNYNLNDKCKIIKNFQQKLLYKNRNFALYKEEVYKLFFGYYNQENSNLKGLIYHCGNIDKNEIGAESCLEFLAKLIDYEYNTDCDYFISVLNLIKPFEIIKLNFSQHFNRKKPEVVKNCFKIIKAIINEERGLTIENFIEDEDIIEKFTIWSLSLE